MEQIKGIPPAFEDGHIIPEIGPWAEEKYRLIALYDELFSKGMKDKWGKRVYIDLYSGAGFGRVKGTGALLMGSPLIALNVEYPFDRYIFCERDSVLLDALQARVKRIAPSADAVFIGGSCDDCVEEILRGGADSKRTGVSFENCCGRPLRHVLRIRQKDTAISKRR